MSIIDEQTYCFKAWFSDGDTMHENFYSGCNRVAFDYSYCACRRFETSTRILVCLRVFKYDAKTKRFNLINKLTFGGCAK